MQCPITLYILPAVMDRTTFVILCSVSFHIIQISVEFSIVVLEECIKAHLRTIYDIIDIEEINIIIYLFQLFALHNIFVHVFGVYLIHKAVRLPYDPYLAFLFKCWLCFAAETCLFHAIKAVFSIRLMAKVEDCSANSLLSGIERYNFDIHWNVIWNKIQHSHSCCGVTGYKDWDNIVWRNAVEESYFDSLKRANRTLVPSSCCVKSTLCNIVLPEIFTNTSLLELPDHSENIVNQNGCLQPLIWRITTIFQLVAILCSVQVIIQFIIFILIRITFVWDRQYM